MLWNVTEYGFNVLNDPKITSFNKLSYHVPSVPFADKESALYAPMEQSPFYKLLSGVWKFSYFESVNDVPEKITDPTLKDDDWKDIPVPSNWQLKGYGIPTYLNNRYVWEPDRQKVNSAGIDNLLNPAGVYRRSFTVPESFSGRETIISFEGAESGLIVYVNGKFAGYSANGRSAADFIITPFIKEGENQLTVIVTAFTAASFLECQDMWRLSGIIRDVSIYSVPKLHLYDYFAWNKVNSDRTQWALELETKIINHTDKAALCQHVRASIYDDNGNLVGSGEGETENKSHRFDEQSLTDFFTGRPNSLQAGCTGTAYIEIPVNDPHLWSAEDPYLYKVVIELLDDNGDVSEYLSFRHGFRVIECVGCEIRINGKTQLIRGVNRHEFSAKGGHVVTRGEMIEDILMMKRNNVNSVRCSHYPNDRYWYDLCDEYGLYVMDEANIETHGVSYRRNLLPGNDPKWFNANMDRISAMVQCDKNHPSIVIWSMGNELGFGENVAFSAAYCRAYDPTRLIHKRQMHSIADMYSDTYPSPADMIYHAKNNPNRPFITNEYGHAMGNAIGNLKEYWDAFRKYPQLGGGYIWEWCDQGIYDEKLGFTYGGDHCEPAHDNNFCIDGLVTPDRGVTPKLLELKKVHEFAQLSMPQEGVVCIKNEYSFTDLSDFDMVVSLKEDGETVHTYKTQLPAIMPDESREIALDLPERETKPGVESAVSVSVRYHSYTPFCAAGYEMASETFVLPSRNKAPAVLPQPQGEISVEETAQDVRVFSEKLDVSFDKASGFITNYAVNGKEMASSFVPSYFRAPTDNDAKSPYILDDVNWFTSGLANAKWKLNSLTAEKVGSRVKVTTVHQLESNVDKLEHKTCYVIDPSGRVQITVSSNIGEKMPQLARIGVRVKANSSLKDVVYYGLGPMETYPDRKTCGQIGRYTDTVDNGNQHFYIKPQEYGDHADTRLFALCDQDGGFAVVSSTPVSMKAVPFTSEELADAAHSTELRKSDDVFLYIDYKMCGLGNRSCGSEVLPEYRLFPGRYTYSFSLVPFEDGQDPIVLKNSVSDLPEQFVSEPCVLPDMSNIYFRYRDPSDPDVRKALGYK